MFPFLRNVKNIRKELQELHFMSYVKESQTFLYSLLHS